MEWLEWTGGWPAPSLAAHRAAASIPASLCLLNETNSPFCFFKYLNAVNISGGRRWSGWSGPVAGQHPPWRRIGRRLPFPHHCSFPWKSISIFLPSHRPDIPWMFTYYPARTRGEGRGAGPPQRGPRGASPRGVPGRKSQNYIHTNEIYANSRSTAIGRPD